MPDRGEGATGPSWRAGRPSRRVTALLIVLGVLAAETIEEARCAGHHLAGGRVVGVEGTQRVEVDALAHLGRERRLVLVQVILQLGPVGRIGLLKGLGYVLTVKDAGVE